MTLDERPAEARGFAGSGAGTGGSNEGSAPRRPRGRRWMRRLTLAVILLAIVVFCLPYLVSTGPGTRFVVSAANGYLPGNLGVQDMSLSWRGPCEIKGLRLDDPEKREVVHAEGVVLAAGVWRLATSTFQFEKLNINSPRINLYVDEQGRISLLRAIGAGERPADETEPLTLPGLTGKLAVHRGSLKIVRADGRELEMSQIDGDFTLDAMSTMTGRLVVQARDVGTVSAEVDVQQLAREGRLQPMEASGKARLSTPADLSLAGLGKFALGEAHADGTANLQAEVSFARGEVTVDTRVAMAGLQVRRIESKDVAPIDVRLSAQVRATQASLTVQAALEGEIGDGQLSATYPWPEQAAGLSLDDIVSGVLAGKVVKWPDVLVEAKSRVDLARLAQAVPALLRIHPDVVVTGGELNLEQVVLRGGEKPSTTGGLVLRKLASRRERQVSEWEPVSLNWDAGIEPGTGLRVEKAAFTSGFARLTAKGSPSDLHADFQTDLARLRQQAAQVFDMGDLDLAGTASGTLDLKRISQERIDLALAMAAEGIRYRAGERHLDVGKLSAKKNGYFTLADSKVSRLTITDASWDADGRVAGTGSGWAGVGDGALVGEWKISRADLAYVADRLAGLGFSGAAGYTGEAALQVKAERRSPSSSILSDGTVVVRNTGLRGEPLLSEEVSLNWSGLSISPDGKQVEIKSAGLNGVPARLSATEVSIRADQPPMIGGKVEGSADLARCLAIGSRIAGRETPPAIAGRLSFSTTSQGTADEARLSADARIEGLAIGAGDKTIREEQLLLAVQAVINRRQETIAFDRFQLDSRMLAVKMAGKISDYAKACLLDLRGDYRASWDAISALIHELAPATADTLAVAGTSESLFTITGTARHPQVDSVLKDASAATEVGWASAEIGGVQMGKASLAPALKQGLLTVPVAAIPAAGGQVRLGGDVDFRSGTPVLNLGPRLQILENIRITPKLGQTLLSRVNPIFGSMARVEGTVSLMTENIQLPLGADIKTGGSGRGRLDLQNLRIQPAGFLMLLLELGGLTGGDDRVVQAGNVDFHLKDGRLYYENFALSFGQSFDLRFHGSVGFDDTLDLAVSIPVRPTFLEKLGVVGPTAEYARRLDKARVQIPIAGTRLQPRLDLAQVDLKPLIEEAARSAVSQTADGLLNGLLGIQQQAPKGRTEPVSEARTVIPGPQPARPIAEERGRTAPERSAEPPRVAPREADRTVQRGPQPAAPPVREQARVALTRPAVRQEPPKPVATPSASPAAQTSPSAVRLPVGSPTTKPTGQATATRSGPISPTASRPAPVASPVRERAVLPTAKPNGEAPARTPAASQPAVRRTEVLRSAVRDRVISPQTKPASRPASQPS